MNKLYNTHTHLRKHLCTFNFRSLKFILSSNYYTLCRFLKHPKSYEVLTLPGIGYFENPTAGRGE